MPRVCRHPHRKQTTVRRLARLVLFTLACVLTNGAWVPDAHAAPTGQNLTAPELTIAARGADHLVLQFTPGAATGDMVSADALLAVPSLQGLALSPRPDGLTVELGASGHLRGQAVVAVHVEAAAGAPPMRVELTWTPGAHADRAGRTLEPAFHHLLRGAVLNPEDLPPPTLQTSASQAAPAAVIAPQESVNTLNIAIPADGFYRLGYDDLAAAGFDPAALDPATLQLWHHGEEIALSIVGGEDGRFDPGDSVLFYATTIPAGTTAALYTTQDVYQLTAGVVPGRRMDTRLVPPEPAPDAFSFLDQRHAAPDTFYWVTMPRDAGDERWFWDGRLAPDTAGIAAARAYTLTLGAPTPNGDATLTARLQGVTTGAHRTQLQLNGTVVGDVAWSGRRPYTATVTVAQSLLRTGANRVDVHTLAAGTEVDQILVDGFSLAYRARYVADDDYLAFAAPDADRVHFTLTGFTRPDVPLYDITDPHAPVVLDAVTWFETGATWTAEFTDDVTPATRYVALPDAHVLSPAAVTRDSPTDWRTPGHGADYLLITHRELYTATLRLAAHRQSQGLRVATVMVDDLYDEFNHGVFHPGAIRDFLAYAYANWQPPAPAYVLLVGDAYQDYRNILAQAPRNFVPSQIIQTDGFGETSSDTWFAAVDGDDVLPDLMLGRLPVKSGAQLDDVIDKLIAYDGLGADAAWQQRVLLVADDDEDAFTQLSARLATHVPAHFTTQRIDVASLAAQGDPVDALHRAMDAGAALLNYAGHGEYYRWGTWQGTPLLHIDDVATLQNGAALPVVTMANCLSGFFTSPVDSLGEALLTHADGGAIAVWAPTDAGTPAAHTVLMDGFYAALLRGDRQTVGAAVASAQLATLTHSPFWGDMIQTFALLGDPYTAVKLAANPPVIERVTPPPDAQDVPVDTAIEIVFSKQIDPATLTVGGLPDGTQVTLDDDGRRALAVPPSLAHGRAYTLTVQAQDGTGAPLAAGPVPVPWRFTTTADAVPPTVTIRASATPITSTTPLRVEFSEAVRPNSVVVTMDPLPTPEDDGDPAWLVWDADSRGATLQHAPFAPDVAYQVVVLAAKDPAGNALAEEVAATFAIAAEDDGEAPRVFLPLMSAP